MNIVKKRWITGADQIIDFYDLLKLTRSYIRGGSKIFIGSDSNADLKETFELIK